MALARRRFPIENAVRFAVVAVDLDLVVEDLDGGERVPLGDEPAFAGEVVDAVAKFVAAGVVVAVDPGGDDVAVVFEEADRVAGARPGLPSRAGNGSMPSVGRRSGSCAPMVARMVGRLSLVQAGKSVTVPGLILAGHSTRAGTRTPPS